MNRYTLSPLPLCPSAPPLPTRCRRVATAVLLLAGLAVAAQWYGRFALGLISLGPWGPVPLVGLVGFVAVVAAVRPSALSMPLAAADRTLGRHRFVASLVVTAITAVYLLATARGQGRPLHPYVHDEFSYLIQAHQFARLRGWMPAHPLASFFDSFQLIDAPVYASAYFPGTALLYVPGIWLGLPPYVTSVLVAAVVAGLLFHVAVGLLDGPAAVAAVLLLWTDGRYRTLSVMTLAQMPLLMWGLAATVAWLRWRVGRAHRWALAIGGCLGMAAITRPLDALCFAIPIGLDVFAWAAPSHGRPARADPAGTGGTPVRRTAWTLLWIASAAVPCLLLQLSLNRGITGHWTQTPFRMYADRDYPGTSYGFHPFDPAARPQSSLPQKRALYAEYRPVVADHTVASAVDNLFRPHATGLSPARVELTLVRLPSQPLPLLLPLVPVALAGLTRRRAVVLATVPLFLLLYVGYVFFFPHYTLVVAPAVVLAVVIGAEQVPPLLPAAARRRARGAVPIILAGLAVAGLPQFDPGTRDELFDAPLIADVDRQLATIAHRPAVVLFAYDPRRNTNEEPVYNADVAWPDDAPIVRAHDLGPARAAQLFAYYAARQPGRFAYRYDERTRTLEPLGGVTALARPRQRQVSH